MSRKQQIIETAIKLFNEHGTQAVTTNHIAAEMGISPGNLYYYFRNKNEIIREIFAIMDRVGMEEYSRITSEHPAGTLEAMERSFIMIQKFNWEFRFFKRELSSLLLGDKDLQQDYARIHQGMIDIVRSGITGGIQAGILVPMDKEELALFADEIWLVTLFWLNYLEVGGQEINETSLARGNDILRNTLWYRMTDAGRSLVKNSGA